MMTLQDRADAYALAFPKWPASWPRVVREQGHDVLYATWCLGADYRNKTPLYGAFPPNFLARVMTLFPDVHRNTTPRAMPYILHAFSGSLPNSTEYLRIDSNPAHQPNIVGRVEDIATLINGVHPQAPWLFDLVFADPPYSKQDAIHYSTPMIHRGRVLAALATVTKPGGHLVYMDQCWPMHKKAQWTTVGRITLIRSTNHRVRMVTIFQRTAA